MTGVLFQFMVLHLFKHNIQKETSQVVLARKRKISIFFSKAKKKKKEKEHYPPANFMASAPMVQQQQKDRSKVRNKNSIRKTVPGSNTVC